MGRIRTSTAALVVRSTGAALHNGVGPGLASPDHMHAEPTVILEVDKRLARFIKTSRPAHSERASPGELARWQAALEVRTILREACPYDRGAEPMAYAAWLVEKYGDDADAVASD